MSSVSLNRPQHFHFVYSIKFIQKSLVVFLIPLVQALIRFDLASLYTALVQELALAVTLVLVSVVVWRFGRWQLGPGGLTLEAGVLWQRTRTLTPDRIAVVELRRTVPLRLLGATRVTLYLVKGESLPQVSFYLSRREAEP